MYFADHVPPHVHAEYAEYEARIAIESLMVLSGTLPPRAMGLVSEDRLAHGRHRGPGPARVALPGLVMTRYCGWYASRTRGMRRRQAAEDAAAQEPVVIAEPAVITHILVHRARSVEPSLLPASGFWLPAPGFRLQASGFRLPASPRPRPPAGCVVDAPPTRPDFRIGTKKTPIAPRSLGVLAHQRTAGVRVLRASGRACATASATPPTSRGDRTMATDGAKLMTANPR